MRNTKKTTTQGKQGKKQKTKQKQINNQRRKQSKSKRKKKTDPPTKRMHTPQENKHQNRLRRKREIISHDDLQERIKKTINNR